MAALAHLPALRHATVAAARAGIGWLQVGFRQDGSGHCRLPAGLGLLDCRFHLAGVQVGVQDGPRPLCVQERQLPPHGLDLRVLLIQGLHRAHVALLGGLATGGEDFVGPL